LRLCRNAYAGPGTPAEPPAPRDNAHDQGERPPYLPVAPPSPRPGSGSFRLRRGCPHLENTVEETSRPLRRHAVDPLLARLLLQPSADAIRRDGRNLPSRSSAAAPGDICLSQTRAVAAAQRSSPAVSLPLQRGSRRAARA